MSEAIWIIGLCAVWWGVLTIFRRYRRKTQAYAEWKTYKGSLPASVRLFELVVLLLVFLPISIALILMLIGLGEILHPSHKPGSVAGAMIAFSGVVAAVTPAALLANLVSLVVPPIRQANLAAMKVSGDISFGSANKGLLLFGSIVTPLALAQGILAAFEPWAH